MFCAHRGGVILNVGKPYMPFLVRAHWDREANVWWAESDDILGLVAEADTVEGLVDDIRAIVPDLMQMNAQTITGAIDIHLVADRVEDISVAV